MKIGWIGLGRMGLPMALRLADGGDLAVFNRTAERAAPLADRGARVASDPAAAAYGVDTLFTMVFDDAALHDVTGGEQGALRRLRRGTTLIDMSTVSVEASCALAAAAEDAGVRYLRAPVSGSVAMAETGGLTVLASGPRAAFNDALPLLRALSAKQFHVGEAEEARVLKLALNLMIGASAAMLGEALTLGEKGGVDWNTMLDVIAGSAVASPFVAYKAGQLRQRNFAPMFSARQMQKDFGLIDREAAALGVPLPIANDVADYWRQMIAQGHGDLDFIACLLAVEQAAGLRR